MGTAFALMTPEIQALGIIQLSRVKLWPGECALDFSGGVGKRV